MAARARPVLRDLGLDVSLRQPVEDLSLAQRQLIEIAKALLTEPRILILDEPTSALGASSTEMLLDTLRVLRDRQVGVVFVSHILEDVMALCDEVTVLRDGHVAMSAKPRAELTVPVIVKAMLGQPAEEAQAQAAADPDAALREQVAEALDVEPPGAGARLELRDAAVEGGLEPLALTVEAGEVVGLAGVAGAGHHTVLELDQRPAAAGQRLGAAAGRAAGSARAAARDPLGRRAGDGRPPAAGPDARQADLGEHRPDPLGRARGRRADRARRAAARARARRRCAWLKIRSSSVDQPAGSLSGGNQQKVVFAKWLDAQPSVVLLDDPTRGVDVGAKAEMHALIRSTAAAGAPVLICSTDIDELASLCDRVVVLHQGAVSAELAGDALQTHAVLEAMNTGALEHAA